METSSKYRNRLIKRSQHCQPVPPPVDKLPIEKTGEAHLSSGVQSICDAEKVYGRHR